MNHLYAFQLGRLKDLCLAELKHKLGEKNFVELAGRCAIFHCKQNPLELQDHLGGTIKIIEIMKSTTPKQIQLDLEEILHQELIEHKNKIPFAISTYNVQGSQDINSKTLLNFSKKILKSLKLHPKFINRGPKNPSSGAIYKSKIVKKGLEINVIETTNGLQIGKTVTIQNIDRYSLRDYKKPIRDTKVGMTPPKLCQIMINLAGEVNTIYDPFCGTGTFLMEAMLMNKKAIGSDLEERMVEAADKNCYWTSKKFELEKNYKIFQRDARFLNESLTGKVDAIVTEGYLGEPFRNLPPEEVQEKELRELGNLHLNWLNAAHHLLPTDGKIVMCLTAYRTKKGLNTIPHFENLAQTAGYQLLEEYLYERPDQVVARKILVLKKP